MHKWLFPLLLFSSCIREMDNLEEVREFHVSTDIAPIYEDLPLFDHPLSLKEIIDIALERNLDIFVKEHEIAVQSQTAEMFAMQTLPQANFNFEQWGRNRHTGAFSESLVPNIPPAPPSIGQTQNVTRYTAGYVFNVLDFAMAIFRSKMEINKALVQKIDLIRFTQTMQFEITKQYWKAIAAKVAHDRAETLIPKLRAFQERLDSQIARRLTPEIEGLTNKGIYVNILMQIEGYSKDYHDAIYILKQTMGIPPETNLVLALEDMSTSIEIDPNDIPDLEQIALRSRPELYSKDVEEKIAMDEIRLGLYSMIPGLAPFAQADYDGNRFLIFNHWLSAGIRSTWDLLKIPSHYYESETGWAKKYLARAHRLNQSLIVLTQVNLGYFTYYDTKKQYELMSEISKIKKRLFAIAQVEVRAGEFPMEYLLRFEGESILAEISAYKAYGDMKTALEGLNNAIGIPFYLDTECAANEGAMALL